MSNRNRTPKPSAAERCLENLINGNLTEAKKQASSISYGKLLDTAEQFMSQSKARAAVNYLKAPATADRQRLFQTYCDA